MSLLAAFPKMNKISIITVNRNNAVGLEKTIRSVIEQTYTNYEYIVIDGASTDESVDVIKKYQSKISHWISEKDSGIYNAMNKGIKMATGDYCYFLNSADSLASIDTLAEIFSTTTYNAPYINGHQLNDFGTQQQRVACLNRPLTLFDFYWGTIKHQATFIRRNLFDTYGLYDESLRITADWKFFLQTIGLHNQQPVFVDVDVVNFEWDGLSTNPQMQHLNANERSKVLDECVPASIRADYERFHAFSNYQYLFDKMKRHKAFLQITKTWAKFFR